MMWPIESCLVLNTHLAVTVFRPGGNSVRAQTSRCCIEFISSFAAAIHFSCSHRGRDITSSQDEGSYLSSVFAWYKYFFGGIPLFFLSERRRFPPTSRWLWFGLLVYSLEQCVVHFKMSGILVWVRLAFSGCK